MAPENENPITDQDPGDENDGEEKATALAGAGPEESVERPTMDTEQTVDQAGTAADIADGALDQMVYDPVILKQTIEELEVKERAMLNDIESHPPFSFWGTVLRLALPVMQALIARKKGELNVV